MSASYAEVMALLIREACDCLECAYKRTPCRGKIEWHHPCSEYPNVGLYLCEAHHSILQGRKKLYLSELCVNLDDLYADLKSLELEVVRNAGLAAEDINKR